MAINRTANSPYTPPYAITEESGYGKLNDLFKQVFKDKANLGIKDFDGLTKDNLAPSMADGVKTTMPTTEKELFLNKTGNGYDLCVRIGADVYKITLTKM